MSRRKDWSDLASMALLDAGRDGRSFHVCEVAIHWRGRAALCAALRWYIASRQIRRVARGIYRGETPKEKALREKRMKAAIAKGLQRWEDGIKPAAYERMTFLRPPGRNMRL